MDRGAREYCQKFGGNVRHDFPKVARDAVAQDYADEFKNDTDAAREHTARSFTRPTLREHTV